MIARRLEAEDREMTKAERSKLMKLEEVIESGVASFIETGNALATVRDNRLYREDYDTFDEYCIERWGFSRQRASQLATAAEVCQPLVDSLKPANEKAARALKHVEPERRAEVMEKAAEGGGRVSAARIAQAASEIEGNDDPKPKQAVVNEAGEEVPERLEWAFADMGPWSIVDSQLRALKKGIKELAAQDVGAFLDFQQIEVDLKNVATAIKFARPYGICPECGGKSGGCKVCRKQGFVPKDVHARVTAAGETQ